MTKPCADDSTYGEDQFIELFGYGLGGRLYVKAIRSKTRRSMATSSVDGIVEQSSIVSCNQCWLCSWTEHTTRGRYLRVW